MNFKITHICENIKDINWEIGRIAGVYNNCFNVLTEGNELLTFFKETDKFSTRAVLTNVSESMSLLPLSDGMRVTKFENCIFAGNVIFDFGFPEIILTKRSKISAIDDISENIEILKSTIKVYGKKSPVFTDTLLSQKVKRGLELLRKEPKSGFEALVGLGVGLTPSCDDIISGMSAYFHLRGIGQSFNNQLSDYLKVKGDFVTTTVSKNLLYDVSKGYINNTLHDVVKSVMTDKNSIEKNALKMFDYGSTSGTETCFGVTMGYLLESKGEMIKWL